MEIKTVLMPDNPTSVPNKEDLVSVSVKGGILSPGDLLQIMEVSTMLGNKYVMFGSRQDILFPSNGTLSPKAKRVFRNMEIDYEQNGRDSHQNIVSSYVAVNIIGTTNWVKEDTYHHVLDNFDYRPKMKINIVEPVQNIVPLFTGHFNFIAATEENYWYLYIRNPYRNNVLEPWPGLILSGDIAKVAKALEKKLQQSPKLSAEELFVDLHSAMRISNRKVGEKLKMPDSFFPYYEGFNAMTNNLLWLGLYWRNNKFDIDFLRAACRLCQDTNIGKISITPWKSFIIKGIKAQDQMRWEKLMGKFGINMRHSSLELNWHLPVLDREALELKRFLVRELDQQDISTHGLTFTIKTRKDSLLFTSIVIEKNHELSNNQQNFYNILYARDFNPNHTEYYVYAHQVLPEVIPALLIELSKSYFRQLTQEKESGAGNEIQKASASESNSYQCINCLTVYNKKFGDSSANIRAGTPFEQLPDDYRCHVCDSGKEFFRPIAD